MTFKVDGLANIQRAMKELPERVARNVLTSAVRAGGQVIRKDALSRIRDKKAIILVKRRSPKGTALFSVGLTKEKWKLRFLEFGTAPHVIKSKTGKNMTDGSTFFGRVVRHPGMSARPFLRPAFDGNIMRAIEVIRVQAEKRIAKEAEKLRK